MPAKKWRCRSCRDAFNTEEDCVRHHETIKTLAQSVPDRLSKLTLKWQQLMLDMQHVQAHSKIDLGTEFRDTEDSEKELFHCPHQECRGTRKPYTERRSLERHYRTHIRTTEVCQVCQKRLHTTLRHYEIHLDRCLKNPGTNILKEKAQRKRRQLFKLAREELDGAISPATSGPCGPPASLQNRIGDSSSRDIEASQLPPQLDAQNFPRGTLFSGFAMPWGPQGLPTAGIDIDMENIFSNFDPQFDHSLDGS